MNNRKIRKPATYIRFAFAFLFLMTGVACRNDTLTITGRVVDESGNFLGDVAVTACYSGWGRGEAGYLVWDKDFCSETSQTNRDGVYVIIFKGPASSRLWARKDGWVQTQDYNTTHSRIVLVKSKDHSSRHRDVAKQRDLAHQQRRAEESETDYYCRVILPENQHVNLNYQDETLAITPSLLVNDGQSDALFAVRGSLTSVSTFADELVIKINSEVPGSNISLKPVETSCGVDVHFIEVNIPGLNGWPDAGVEILVPSVSAMFDTQIHGHSIQQ